MNKKIEKKIEKIYKEVFKEIFTKDRLRQAERGDKKVIQRAITDFENSKKYEEFCKRFATRLTKYGLSKEKGLWRKYYQAAKDKRLYGIPSTYTAFEKSIYNKIIKHNFTMIKSVPSHIRKVYEQKDVITLLRQVLEGKVGRGTFERQLRSHGFKNAKLIARTETAKLQTAITENRAKDIGSVAYIWRSSHDVRTRPSHRAMNDVVVLWRPDKEKPLLDKMRGNAGEFPNCRCAVLPLFDRHDLKQSTYKVYNYKTDKIVRMTKKQLENVLSSGKI